MSREYCALLLACFGLLVGVVELHLWLGVAFSSLSFVLKAKTKHTLVLVMSARGNFEARRAIRETWAFNESDVVFVLGNRSCRFPAALQAENASCALHPERAALATTDVLQAHADAERELDAKVAREAAAHGDLVVLDLMDSYGNLAAKLLAALEFGLEQRAADDEPYTWLMKVDDDVVMQMDELRSFAATLTSTNRYRVVGLMQTRNPVLRSGKWAETRYAAEYYPTYPQGASGYILSRLLVSALVERKNELTLYHNEDASVGIWIDDLALRPVYLENVPRFNLGCKMECCSAFNRTFLTSSVVLGHQFTPQEILECGQEHLGFGPRGWRTAERDGEPPAAALAGSA